MNLNSRKKHLISLIVLILFSILAFGSSEGETDKKITASVMAESFVEKRLKAPSTADFASYSSSQVTELGGNKYKVVSYVDSENGFGAMIRTNFEVVVRDNGDETWNLISINTW